MSSSYGPLTLGEFISKLETTLKNDLPPQLDYLIQDERYVYYDWANMKPGKLFNNKGHPYHLTLTIVTENCINIKDLITISNAAVNRWFTAPNGVQHWMDSNTPVWVGNPSEISYWGISDVKDYGGHIELITKYFD